MSAGVQTNTANGAASGAEAAARHTAQGLFFIVGCGRSGTSLLQAMLSSHPDVILPVETKFFSVVAPGLPGAMDAAAAWAHAQRHWWIREMQLDEARVLDAARASGLEVWPALFLGMLTAFRERHGRARVGEKSPGHVRHVPELARWYPQSRFIHIVRDPRAVCLSFLQAEFAGKHLARHIRAWRNAIDLHRREAARMSKDRYAMVRYEDLVRDPEPELRRLCDLLALPFDAAMLDPSKREHKGFGERQAQHMANTLKPVFTSSIDKWRSAMRPEHVALVEHALAVPMVELGYELSGARTPAPGLKLAASAALDAAARAVAKATGANKRRAEG